MFDPGELHDIWIHINARTGSSSHGVSREHLLSRRHRMAGSESPQRRHSRPGSHQPHPHKPALRIDFNRYVAGQEFLGLKSLALDNLWQDPSMIRERLAMQIFQRMGLRAPRESHARVCRRHA